MATETDKPALPGSPKPNRFPWLIACLALIFCALALVDLYGQVLYSLNGERTQGTVVEFHKSSARSASVTAQVSVVHRGAPPFRWEVDDSLGVIDWREGGTVPLLCTQIHADHVSCVVDSLADRYLWPVLMLLVGGLVTWGSLRGVRRKDAGASPGSRQAPPSGSHGA